ncbi:predicted protein [Nematostella vectensis]|uniref:Uncharacterized protein n=1 Tax=Nematostella vectensis TaxID=45351 RepID=A7S8H4_NEMVE|nr:predicted protein [Nematostella vectensis]|eukprot:XP_001632004.1 predicted protein [Nematostella vectensis]
MASELESGVEKARLSVMHKSRITAQEALSIEEKSPLFKPKIRQNPLSKKGQILLVAELSAAAMLSLFIVPLLFLVLVVLKAGLSVLKFYVKRKYNCIPLKEDDAVWQQETPTNRHIIHAFMLMEGEPNVAELKSIVCERLVFRVNDQNERICPRMTQAIKRYHGVYVWQEDCQFSIDKHFCVWDGKLAKTKQELEEVISEIASMSLPDNQSPWQFYVVPTKFESPSFVFLLRIHHSVGDGVSLTRVFVKNLYDKPPVGIEPKKFSTKHRLLMWCKAILVGPMVVVKKFLTKPDFSLVHGQALSGKKVVSWSTDVNMALVKHIKNMTGTTVNDVMVSCISGAIHDYLKKHGITQPEDMWASVPVDIRSTRNSLTVENKFALVFLRLPVVAGSPLERLYAAKERMDVIKTSAEPLVTSTTVTLLMMLPGWFSRVLINFFSNKMSCVLSNIPGPAELLSVGGQVVKEGIFWPPQRASIGLGLSIFSYGGGMRVGVFADKNIIPYPAEVTEGFVKNFNELANSLNCNKRD